MTNKVQTAGGDVVFMTEEEKREIIRQVNKQLSRPNKPHKPFTGRTKRNNPKEGEL